jgi:hypothetical protein
LVLALPSAAELLQQLQAARGVRLQGWSISGESQTLWVTNPYGVDVGHHNQDTAGCSAVLAHIDKVEQYPASDREWRHL